ncbi:MAG: septation protein IspZ [Bacteriovoracaceae bacterium]|nr:septation protein IspZ [Bacteriovoracaceae bacterium]
MSKKRPSLLHWLSFLPALAYWWLEETQPLEIALGVGMGLALLEIVIEKIYSGKIHTLTRLNFGIIIMLGFVSVFAKEGVWFKLQPTITGYVCATWLTLNQVKGNTMILEAMEEMGRPWPFPKEWIRDFEKHIIGFCYGYGTFMAYWAIWGTTSQWAFWKTGGQYMTFGVFMTLEFIWLRRKMKKAVK